MKFLKIRFLLYLAALVFLPVSCAGEPPADAGPIERLIPAVWRGEPAVMPEDRLGEGWWKERHEARSGANVIPNQKVIFIGDSITQYWEGTAPWAQMNSQLDNKVTNLGYGADQTQHVIWRLQNGEFPEGINPEYVVIHIGTNNSWHGAQDRAVSTAAGIGSIVKIINRVSPSTKIILLAILPRGGGLKDFVTIRNDEVNGIIKSYDGYLNIQFLDMRSEFLKPGGALKTELFTDNLHLSAAGYNIWKDKVLEIVE